MYYLYLCAQVDMPINRGTFDIYQIYWKQSLLNDFIKNIKSEEENT